MNPKSKTRNQGAKCIAEADASIGEFIEGVYNQKRLHSALGYVSPAEFEQKLRARP